VSAGRGTNSILSLFRTILASLNFLSTYVPKLGRVGAPTTSLCTLIIITLSRSRKTSWNGVLSDHVVVAGLNRRRSFIGDSCVRPTSSSDKIYLTVALLIIVNADLVPCLRALDY